MANCSHYGCLNPRLSLLYTEIVKILLVEDTHKLAALITENLQLQGCVVEMVETAEDALRFTEADTYDVIILDRMLPNNQDGLDVCEKLRKRGDQTPILMLTALGNVEHKMEGFGGGADDYLAKPFDMRELLARVSALARRKETPASTIVTIGTITINLSKQEVMVNNQQVTLSKRQWRLLEYLAMHQGQTVSKDILIDRVWGMDSDVLENAVEAAVRKLRQKLNDDKGETIQTVHGFGYRLKNNE